jgi:hypothetical protein
MNSKLVRLDPRWIAGWILAGISLCGTWGNIACADAAGDALGMQIASNLRARYMDTRMDCGKASAPGFVCNGVIFRATIPSSDYKFWEPSPKSVANGGASFSYLRADSKFRRLVRYEDNGYIVFAPLSTPVTRIRIHVLCAFPVDGATDTRADLQGCGASSKSSTDSRPCHEQGIYTGEQWFEKHKKNNYSNVDDCGFNVRNDANEKATQSFAAFIKAKALDDARSFDQQNEFRLAVWDAKEPAKLPIEALFYLPGGLPDAQHDQKDYFASTGRFLPIIAMTLPQDRGADASFNYNPGDQLAFPDEFNGAFIRSGEWVDRYDPGTKKNEWTLSILLTPRGRDALPDTTDAVYRELVQKFGDDPRWKENDRGGMRRQLVCHYVLARYKVPWNLEPFRPNVTEAVAEANGCNPL